MISGNEAKFLTALANGCLKSSDIPTPRTEDAQVVYEALLTCEIDSLYEVGAATGLTPEETEAAVAELSDGDPDDKTAYVVSEADQLGIRIAPLGAEWYINFVLMRPWQAP